jgi:hypothetical protein
MAQKPKTKKAASPGKKKSAPRRRAAKPTADEQVESSSGVQLLLGNMAPDKDATYHYENILGWMAKVKSAQGSLGEARKKAEESGVRVKALTDAMKLEKADPLDVAGYLKELQRTARLRGFPVQIGLFEPKFGSIEDQAMSEGWAAGKAGRTPDMTRWPEGSPGHVPYMRRWNDAQADTVEGMGDSQE